MDVSDWGHSAQAEGWRRLEIKPEYGKLALIDSGEYLGEMAEIEASLMLPNSKRYVQIPTASTLESRERVEYWVRLGEAQAKRLGFDAVPLVVTSREDADDESIVSEIAGAGLIYFSGGNPNHLVSTLIGTRLLDAIRAAWMTGTPIAGCSAGAMALGSVVAGFRSVPPKHHPAFGFADVVALPHFDRMIGRLPGVMKSGIALAVSAGNPMFGIDELTAVVLEPSVSTDNWSVLGAGAVWVGGRNGSRSIAAGEVFRTSILET